MVACSTSCFPGVRKENLINVRVRSVNESAQGRAALAPAPPPSPGRRARPSPPHRTRSLTEPLHELLLSSRLQASLATTTIILVICIGLTTKNSIHSYQVSILSRPDILIVLKLRNAMHEYCRYTYFCLLLSSCNFYATSRMIWWHPWSIYYRNIPISSVG